jgi:4-coumarate--CoA ligase (photoactive yellow protein activation family)
MRSWWLPQGVARRFVTDLLADEIARQRRGGAPLPPEWRGEWRLDEDLGCDSLELVALATALAEALHLHESGIEDYLLARRTLDDWVAIAQAGLTRFSDRLTFRTSGSTGLPKPCMHPLGTLLQETQHLATLLPGRRRVLCAVPSHHIYGFLFSVLLPRDLGLAPEDVIDLRTSTPAWLARGARPGDLVIAHPLFWQATARTVPRLPPDVVGVTSTAPCPDSVAEALLAAGLARLLQVYGSTETAGIGARDSHAVPFTLFPYWRPGGEEGLVRTPPEGGECRHAPPDGLRFCSPRTFSVGPRHDAAVQVGGTNVFPSRVREVLRRHPAVQDAAVRLMRPEEGERLKAFVVPREGVAAGEALASGLRAWVDQQLAAPERPRAFRFGQALPHTPAGKPADWSLD